MTTPLISARDLMALRAQRPDTIVLDCGFDLFNPQAGEQAWGASRLPGALYAHLDRDLSSPKSARGPIEGGRHPLPSRAAWIERVRDWGIGSDTPVVAYDDQGGPYAARAWWLLRWIGHEAVWVLDGGKAAWVAQGGALEDSPVASAAAVMSPTASGATLPSGASRAPGAPTSDAAPAMATIDADGLWAELGRVVLVDARVGERFRGETEPLDTRAGHIPGALNRFFKDNLQPDGRFKPAEQLRQEWLRLLPPGADARTVVHQCGSGVTACHNLLALAHAGLGEGRLYPGSWSEWSADPARPVALG